MHATPSYRWLRFVTVGLCTVALSGCIPTDTTIRKGGVAIHVNPSEATRTGRFRTGDGWDVTLQIARISLSARISTCVDVSEYGEDSYAAYSGGGDNEGDARKPILLEIRAADASSRCILHVEPQGTYARRDSNGVVQDADPNTLDDGFALRLSGVARKLVGADAGRRVTFDVALRSFGYNDEAPTVPVRIPSNDKTDVHVELRLEDIFVPDESPFSFQTLVDASGGDDDVNTQELSDAGHDEAGSIMTWPAFVFARRLAKTVKYLQ